MLEERTLCRVRGDPMPQRYPFSLAEGIRRLLEKRRGRSDFVIDQAAMRRHL
jgi:hypothetical protein